MGNIIPLYCKKCGVPLSYYTPNRSGGHNCSEHRRDDDDNCKDCGIPSNRYHNCTHTWRPRYYLVC